LPLLPAVHAWRKLPTIEFESHARQSVEEEGDVEVVVGWQHVSRSTPLALHVAPAHAAPLLDGSKTYPLPQKAALSFTVAHVGDLFAMNEFTDSFVVLQEVNIRPLSCSPPKLGDPLDPQKKLTPPTLIDNEDAS
jgi:hypothetical protein